MRPYPQTAAIAAVLACAATAWAAPDAPDTASVVAPAPPPRVPARDWDWHVQNTDIYQGYPAFHSAYSGTNSLPAGGQMRETISLDVLLGVRLWPGAEAHVDGMMWQGYGLNNTLGADGFPSAEAVRLGTTLPNGSITRLFIRQTIGLGGEQEDVAAGPLALPGRQDVSRVTLTLGRLSVKDIFDNNTYAADARTQFMNWGLVANESWDYSADAIGFVTGFAAELNQPDWTLRYGFFQMPEVANSLTWEDRYLKWPYDSSAHSGPFLKAWGMVTEFERRYTIGAHPGIVRLLAYVNQADMGNYQDAVSSPTRPADILASAAYRFKYGFAVNAEQELVKNVGAFSRVGWSDGRNQAWAFSDVDYTATAGLSLKGALWGRAGDTFGLGGVLNGISKSHQEYFAAGGSGILAGDGNLDYGWEKIVESYYDLQIHEGVRFAVDYQFIADPAFNRARGPVSVFGGRLHWEF